MSSSSLLNNSVKTAFLFAFALAKRRSELYALSVGEGHIHFSENGVALSYEAGFLSKTLVPTKVPEPLFIPSLDQVFRSDDGDGLLCSIRAFRFYLGKNLDLASSGFLCPLA